MDILTANEMYRKITGKYPVVKVIKENGFICLNDIVKPFPGARLSVLLKLIDPVSNVVSKIINNESVIVKEGRGGGVYAHPSIVHAVQALISPEVFFDMISKYDTFSNSKDSDVMELELRRSEDLVRASMNKNEKTQCVYVIKDMHNNHIKIGISDKPEDRIKSFSCGSVSPFNVEYQTEQMKKEDAREIETQLHFIYSGKKVKGEWFEEDIKPEVINILSMNYQERKVKLSEIYAKRQKEIQC